MPERIVIADVNRDGFGDVVTYTRRGRIWALLGGGTSSVLQAAHQIGRGYGVAAGDFNGDRNVDLVTGGDRANGVTLLLGHGDGTFARQPAIPVGGSWSDLHTGDFNQDGRADIVLARSNRLVVVPGRGDGTFGKPTVLPVGGVWFTVADLSGDHVPDIVAIDPGLRRITVVINRGHNRFVRTQVLAGFVDQVAATDLTGDDRPDLIVPSLIGHGLRVLEQGPDGRFS